MGLFLFAAGTGLFFVFSLFLQGGLHVSPGSFLLGLVPLTAGLIAVGVRRHGWAGGALGPQVRLPGLGDRGGRLLLGLALVHDAGTSLSLWALAPALVIVGVGTGLCYTTIPVVALGDANADEQEAPGLHSIQQLASALGSAVVSSIFNAARSGPAHAMAVTLVVVLVVLVLSVPTVAMMPRTAPSEPPAGG